MKYLFYLFFIICALLACSDKKTNQTPLETRVVEISDEGSDRPPSNIAYTIRNGILAEIAQEFDVANYYIEVRYFTTNGTQPDEIVICANAIEQPSMPPLNEKSQDVRFVWKKSLGWSESITRIPALSKFDGEEEFARIVRLLHDSKHILDPPYN